MSALWGAEAAFTPASRPNKENWFEISKQHSQIAKTTQHKTLIIGDSIVSGLKRYRSIWHQFFSDSINFGIGGDRTEHVLWRAKQLSLSKAIKSIVIHCGTNNINRDSPYSIAQGIVSVGLVFMEKNPKLNIIISGILPRDLSSSSLRRKKIEKINYITQQECHIHKFQYVAHDSSWLCENGYLDRHLYHVDNLHLIERGNEKLAKEIQCKIPKLYMNSSNHSTTLTSHPSYSFSSNFTLPDDYGIGQSECLGRGWDGLSNPQRTIPNYLSSPSTISRPLDDFPSLPFLRSKNTPVQIDSYDEFPPLPSPCSPTLCHVPRPLMYHVSRPLVPVSVLPNVTPVCKPVPKSVPRCTVSNRVTFPARVIRPDSIQVNVCKSECTTSNHILPMRKLNKVKPPKWEKCDYVFRVPHVASPVKCHVNPPVNSPVKCHVNPPVNSPVKCHVNPPVNSPVKCHVNPPVNSPVKCHVNPSMSSPVEQGNNQKSKSSSLNHYFSLIYYIILNFLLFLFHTPILIFKNIYCVSFSILVHFIYTIFIVIYILFCFIFKFFKYGRNFLLFLLFVYIFIIPLSNDISNNNINIKYNIISHYENNSYIFLNNFENLYLLTKLSPENNNNNNESCNSLCLILSITLLLFFFKTRHKPVLNCFCYGMLFIMFNNVHLNIKYKDTDLHSCSNFEFFTIESINVCSNLTKFHLRNDFKLLTFSKMKYKENAQFLQNILLLSGGISLNPGPNQEHQMNNEEIWSPFKKRGIHFLHVNINSLLPKIDELRHIAKTTNVSIIGISETKLDASVLNAEIDIDNYEIIRKDRNRRGGGVACYIRKDICFNQIDIFSDKVENICFNILLKNLHPITVGILYRPPDQNKFLEELSNDLNKLNLEKTEMILLGDININLLQKGKYILNNFNQCSSIENIMHPLLNQYKQFLSHFGLKQLINDPTRVTCETSTLIDHILTNSAEKVSQCGVFDIASSNDLLYEKAC